MRSGTIRSASQSVCPTTRRISRAFRQEVLRYWMWFFKVIYVKDKTKELCFFDYLYRRFYQKNVRVWGKKTYCWWKSIQTFLEVQNFKPFSDTHFWMLLTHSYLALSTLFNVFPLTHKAKSSTNKEQSVPFKTTLAMLLILILKRAGDRMLPCGTPISRSCSSERVEPTLSLKERSDRNLWINLGRWPLKQRSQGSARMLCFHVVS